MTLHVDNLVLEITRRCNAKCRHCLRGDAQPVDISKEVIDRVLEDMSSIGAITFTGGEPALAVPKIRYFLLQLKARKIDLDSFFLYTNGKVASEPLVQAMLDLYRYCSSNEVTGLQISKDQFHREQIPDTSEAHRLYSALTFYQPQQELKSLKDEAIFYEGRAVEEGLGTREAKLDRCRVESNEMGDLVINGELYINVLGDVVPNCDWSYERQSEDKIGNVLKKSLFSIMKSYDINPKSLIETLSKRVA
jgi:organic radical activating enzyme